MTTKMTRNGISTCVIAGEEKYEKFQMSIGRKKRTVYQYDFRSYDGELFSCVKPTLEACRKERDKWLIQKQNGNG